MAVKSYTDGQTLLFPLLVVKKHDAGNVLLQSSTGQRITLSDSTIKAIASALSSTGGIVADPADQRVMPG